MTSHRSILPVVVALVFAACTPRNDAPETSDSLTTDTSTSVDTTASDTAPVTASAYAAEHRYDLTGDGRPELLTVTTTGDRFDSLDVRLRIFSADDSLLYTTGWNSRLYFEYDLLEGKSDSVVRQIVMGHLERLLTDSAFSPGGIPRRMGRGVLQSIDTSTLRYDVAETIWRREHSLADSLPLPTSAHDDIERIRVEPARLLALVRELEPVPSFSYYAGGEVTETIAWSREENRFVMIFTCC